MLMVQNSVLLSFHAHCEEFFDDFRFLELLCLVLIIWIYNLTLLVPYFRLAVFRSAVKFHSSLNAFTQLI